MGRIAAEAVFLPGHMSGGVTFEDFLIVTVLRNTSMMWKSSGCGGWSGVSDGCRDSDLRLDKLASYG